MRVAVSQMVFPACTRRLVLALQERDALDAYYTAILDHPRNRVTGAAKRGLRAAGQRGVADQIERRSFPKVDYDRVRQRPQYMGLRLLAERALGHDGLIDWLWERGEHDFDRWVARQLRPGLDAVVAEEHAALATFERAVNLGALRVLEQASPHHSQFDRLLAEQVARYPELRDDRVDLYQSEKTARRDARRDAELHAADVVLCHSEVTKQSVVEAGVVPDRVDVVPLGFPAPTPSERDAGGPPSFLYAGNQTARKGVHLLLHAWRGGATEGARLTVVGPRRLAASLYMDLPPSVSVRDWVPKRALNGLYRASDVFVFPTLSDGFAMVVAEAMAMGLPVITTTRAGAADFIEHGRNGLLVPAGDVEALRDQMAWCVAHRHRLREIGAAAAETAASWPWSAYERGVVEALERRVGGRRAAQR